MGVAVYLTLPIWNQDCVTMYSCTFYSVSWYNNVNNRYIEMPHYYIVIAIHLLFSKKKSDLRWRTEEIDTVKPLMLKKATTKNIVWCPEDLIMEGGWHRGEVRRRSSEGEKRRGKWRQVENGGNEEGKEEKRSAEDVNTYSVTWCGVTVTGKRV